MKKYFFALLSVFSISVSAFAKTTESSCEDGATNKIEIVICLQNQRDSIMKNQLQQLKKIFTKKQMKNANKQLDTSQKGWMLDREAICDLMGEVVKTKLKKPIQGSSNYLGDLISYGEAINDVSNECWSQMTDERNETLGELIKAMK
jgi:uncharacterized protein YecT (DUF1311 family)